MTVGELREFLKPFTDECKVYVTVADNGMKLLAPPTITYDIERGEGHLIIDGQAY